MQAIIYARFSSLEQAKGSSIARQIDLCTALCERSRWEVMETITDSGVSAWTGENIETGNLAKLTDRLEETGGEGTVIVVEQLDRLSRQPPLIVLAWLSRVTATGAMLATANDNLIIDAAKLSRDHITVTSTVFNAFRGYFESQLKSERVADAWNRKRAKGEPLTRRTVAWVDLCDGHFIVRPDRAQIVRTIFEMSAGGTGAGNIAKHLNRHGVATFGKSSGWQTSYIKKILANRAVIGEFQPCTKPKGKARRPAGDARPDYYPQIVSDELFQRVQARSRNISRATARNMNNLLSGLGICGNCGAAMTRLYKGPRWEYLRCEKSRRGLCEHRKNYPLRKTVDSILDKLLHRALDPTSIQGSDEARVLNGKIATLARNIEDIENRLIRVRRIYEDGDDGSAGRVLELSKELATTKSTMKDAQATLEKARIALPTGEHLRLVTEVRHLMDSDLAPERDQARTKVKTALDAVIERVVFGEGITVELMRPLGLLIFRPDGSISEFDLAKRGQSVSPEVDAYLQRKDAEMLEIGD